MAAGSPLPRAGPGSPQPGSPPLPALSAAGFVVLGIGLRPADAARAARSAQQRAVESSKRLRDQPRKNSAVCDIIPRRRRPGGDTSCSTCSRRGEGPVGRAALEGSAAPRRLLLPLAEQGPGLNTSVRWGWRWGRGWSWSWGWGWRWRWLCSHAAARAERGQRRGQQETWYRRGGGSRGLGSRLHLRRRTRHPGGFSIRLEQQREVAG